VRALLRESRLDDPYEAIEQRARDLALRAMEHGWSGPPFDPFALAETLGMEVVARQDLADARLVPGQGARGRIEFNPHRRPARVRFSVAHEIGHALFTDHGDRIRYRDRSHSMRARKDDWQLEVLCNIAAAELLMPVGAMPLSDSDDLSLPHLLDLRASFEVSTEALLRRVVKLTSRPVCLFAAARLPGREGFRIDYVFGSRAWHDGLSAGQRLAADSVLSHCTAVGFADNAAETWGGSDVHIQAVGIPPYPGHRYPRIVGLVQPTSGTDARAEGIQYVRGDASRPFKDGTRLIAHIVNNRGRRWGGRGFARALMSRFPDSADEYAKWAAQRGHLALGAVHLSQADDQTWIASLVAQSGYGDSTSPRLRLSALRTCLLALRASCDSLDASVHVPLLGTGQGGMSWPPIRDLLLDEIADHGHPVVVYVLPEAQMPQDAPAARQMTLA
jgi:O-acetyl-ADP-ribose deacetylase (regulator of RNase III)